MLSATVKKARVTASIAQAETSNLPTSSDSTKLLLQQTEEKRRYLTKKCEEYEKLCRVDRKWKNSKQQLLSDNNVYHFQHREIEQQFVSLEQNCESVYLAEQRTFNEALEVSRSWDELNETNLKLRNEIVTENEMNNDLEKACLESRDKFAEFSNSTESNEREMNKIKNGIDADDKTRLTLERYFARLVEDVFLVQRRLEDIVLGTSESRSNLRQDEKLLRALKQRHRQFEKTLASSSKIQNVDENQENLKYIEILSEEWKDVQENIAKTEKKMKDALEALRNKIDSLEQSKRKEDIREKNLEKTRISHDYFKFEKDTPMYAAYSAKVSRNNSKDGSSSTLPVEKSENEKKISTTKSGNSVHFKQHDNVIQEYFESLDYRKKIIRCSKSDAIQKLSKELSTLRNLVSSQRQETQFLDKEVDWLNENIMIRDNDIQSWLRKTDEFLENAERERIKIEKREEFSFSETHSEKDIDLESLNEMFSYLEKERQNLKESSKHLRIASNKLEQQWQLEKSMNRSTKPLEDSEMTYWNGRIDQIEEQIRKIQLMENHAFSANGSLKTNLTLLKPYQEEYQEFEKLVDQNNQLDIDVAKHNLQIETRSLQSTGAIKVFD